MKAKRILFNTTAISILLCGSVLTVRVPLSQDTIIRTPVTPTTGRAYGHSAPLGTSPFAPPPQTDTNFVVDQGPGLDSGCSYRSDGPLIFSVPVHRVVGDLNRLMANGLISQTATLRMPAFDVDFMASIPSGAPEFNRVKLNGRVVPGEFLTGSDNVWKMNVFEVPISWINFPTEPGLGGSPIPAVNSIQIDIDVENTEEHWCTAIDWAEISFEVARPIVMVHGIRSSGATWIPWASRLDRLGVPNSRNLDLGALDSIEENSLKIASEIAAARWRWGVDKVDLIGHSKGGIDARHYVETASDVEQLIQLGTPNAGTPLADAAQSSAIILAGFAGASLINEIAGPAGIQLTTGYMTEYNLMHGGNSNVQYTYVAGDYDPDCDSEKPLCRPIDRLLLSLSGQPGDTIVSVASVHALPYGAKRLHRSAGDDATATHTEIHSNSPVFDGLIFERLGHYRTAVPAGRHGTLSRTATAGGLLGDGEIAEHSFPIDQSGNVLVSLMHADGELEMTLVSPSGIVLDPAVPEVSDDINFQAGDILGGRMAAYAIGGAEVGTWTAKIRASAVAGRVAYAINAWIEEAEITLVGEGAESAIPAGRPIRLVAHLDRVGSPISGAVVSAVVAVPSDGVRSVDLTDDGLGPDSEANDGTYSGMLNDVSNAGLYRVAFVASSAGTGTEPGFSREAFAVIPVSESVSRLSGIYQEEPIDRDGNGLVDELLIGVGVTVSDSAEYRVFGVLTDVRGNRHEASETIILTPGSHMVRLAFKGSDIYRNGVKGPYELTVVRLAEDDTGTLALLPLDVSFGAYVTHTYSHEDFEHSPLLLTGEGSSAGVDTDGNGLIDRLDVWVRLAVDFGGSYEWSARLVDANGTELGFYAGSGFLSAGLEELSFQFGGEQIGENGVDGPYFVSDLLVFGAGQSMVAAHGFATDPFEAAQFEGFEIDADEDGIPNDVDACPSSDLEPTVFIGGYDSEVSNVVLSDGCSISDRIENCAVMGGNRRKFANCVSRFIREMRLDGLLSKTDWAAIRHWLARARIH